ncbi:MAG: ribbon-helix-helix domain-containing protein [Candidatus Diapherotrites archaeon]
MKMLSVAVDEALAKTIDEFIDHSKLYSSRSEFLKDAIRKNLSTGMELNEDLKKIREGAERLAAKARQRGYKGGLPTQKERDKFAREFMKEKGIK